MFVSSMNLFGDAEQYHRNWKNLHYWSMWLWTQLENLFWNFVRICERIEDWMGWEMTWWNLTDHCNEIVFHHLKNSVLKNSSMDNVAVVHRVKKNILHCYLIHVNVLYSWSIEFSNSIILNRGIWRQKKNKQMIRTDKNKQTIPCGTIGLT